MTQFKTINKNGDIQVWSLADYGFDQELMKEDYNTYKELGMIYKEERKEDNNMYILITKNYEKNEKGKWILQRENKQDYSREKWKTHILDSRKFFTRLGGTERLSGDTLTSISPCGTLKTVRTLTVKQ